MSLEINSYIYLKKILKYFIENIEKNQLNQLPDEINEINLL